MNPAHLDSARAHPDLNAAPLDIVAALQNRAASHPDRRALTFLVEGESEDATLSYGQLDARAREVAARIAARVAPGERVLLLLPSGEDYVAAFFGCLYAGAIAVPLYPPRPNRRHERLAAVLDDCRPSLAVANAATWTRAQSALTEQVPLPWLVLDDAATGAEPDAWRAPDIAGADTAFLQ